VWDLKVVRPFAKWDVVSLFNWDEGKPKKVGFRVAELGLDPSIEYLAYEFWTPRFLGTVKRKFETTLPAQSSALLALHPSLGRPQFLSTDRHITQGGVSLRALSWDDKAGRLSGRTQLVAGEATTLTLYVPKGYTLREATAKGATLVRAEQHRDRSASVVLRGRQSKTVEWAAEFDCGHG